MMPDNTYFRMTPYAKELDSLYKIIVKYIGDSIIYEEITLLDFFSGGSLFYIIFKFNWKSAAFDLIVQKNYRSFEKCQILSFFHK